MLPPLKVVLLPMDLRIPKPPARCTQTYSVSEQFHSGARQPVRGRFV